MAVSDGTLVAYGAGAFSQWVEVSACPACGSSAATPRPVDAALGWVEVCVNCLHPRLVPNPSPPVHAAREDAPYVLVVSLRGMTWRGESCPHCGKAHSFAVGFAAPRAVLMHRLEAPCGGPPLLLVEAAGAGDVAEEP